MNVGVVGCNGFVGKHLCLAISKNENINLKLFGKSDFNQTNLNIPYKKINISNKEETCQEFKNIDVIYYLASASIPFTSWENPKVEIEQNLLPFLDFLDCISESNIKKIVFISSAGTIYGSSNAKLTEDINKFPFSPYGINKLTMEYYLNYYNKKNNLNYDIYRVSNIYGENQDIQF